MNHVIDELKFYLRDTPILKTEEFLSSNPTYNPILILLHD